MNTILIPGDSIETEAARNRNHYFVEDNKPYCTSMCVSSNSKIVPLEGLWYPNEGEPVVGVVKEVKNSIVEVDLSHFLRAIIIKSPRDRISFRIGDIIEASVKQVEDKKTIILIFPRLLKYGMLLQVKAVKIPRIIGKNNTMVGQISSFTKSNIIIGYNGLIYIKGGDMALAVSAILKVAAEAHRPGLTESVKKLLERELEVTEK
ncbi:MAG: hypothetical protein M1331_03700 [Candidatus Marsarchaeota archaeon]|nr:hypothetical protein [Candidatus Marsarchaeota archaeon]MCL5106472.1 hypothetical protein [Candidatus Marsarchaeota archaeon]